MRCDEVRPLLAEFSGGDMHEAGETEVHLATCSDCARDLAAYREVTQALVALRDEDEPIPAGLMEALLAGIPPHRIRDDLYRMAQDHPKAQTAALSLGGAVLGAAAVGIIWWRAARRALGASGETLLPERAATA